VWASITHGMGLGLFGEMAAKMAKGGLSRKQEARSNHYLKILYHTIDGAGLGIKAE